MTLFSGTQCCALPRAATARLISAHCRSAGSDGGRTPFRASAPSGRSDSDRPVEQPAELDVLAGAADLLGRAPLLDLAEPRRQRQQALLRLLRLRGEACEHECGYLSLSAMQRYMRSQNYRAGTGMRQLATRLASQNHKGGSTAVRPAKPAIDVINVYKRARQHAHVASSSTSQADGDEEPSAK